MSATSIIIRTFNEEKQVGNLLRAIERQDYKDYELIVVDSGSTDRTLEIVKEFPVKIISIDSKDFTFGYSLNIGCKESTGKYLVMVSAHTLPRDEKWLSNLIAPFDDEKIANVYGRQLGHSTSKFSEKMDFERTFGAEPLVSNTLLDYVNNANAAIRKDLWEKHPFDEYLFGLEDLDWAKCITAEGYLIRYEPSAAVHHIHNEAWHQVFNRFRREAIAAVRIGLKHPPQARISFVRALINFLRDCLSSFPNYSLTRLEEMTRFRYYQWKGSRTGWLQGKNLDFHREKNSIFHPDENQAIVIRSKNKANIESMSIPEMRPGDMLIKVDYVGVCRTDIEVYEGTLGYYRDGIASHPIVPGHEFSGTIVKIGSNNKFQERFKLGQRVVGECVLSRGKDSERKEVGVINYNGAYSKFIVIPGDVIHNIPDGVDSKTAVLTEPLAVVLRALRRLEYRLSKNSKIAVIGAGQIGNLCTQILAFRRYKIDLFDNVAERLCLLPDITNRTSTELTDLDNFDVIIEATGSKDVLEKVLKESSLDSTILLLGFPYGDIEYNFEDIVGQEKVIIGSVGADSEDFDEALNLLSDLDMVPFVQVVMPLKNFEEAWQAHKSLKHLKILLKP
ncbi:MAG: hypothetical protein A3G52_02265 [Candidatus Taylorbacteria bacterium RIFCSPLOWO2_12_FULL_43_20]|uniref:Enoyl reductase (ER) domain-containing protein n=1 Tax=Candidatus Taylorbacteria bacterium RIFCSPLOWO2_12_FULL_43_20 TaxID=1802332 RepID=A0A1G2P3I3_9BACT|nr:MAG: hypothetical protein A3E92_02660 [Candidatus Taylorbacteria bacterium RIFCSPHIGHO2_12_FULL_42_34]OHA42917.1 MAG: hypothetical protein A3G52_02265 [Candidatus Taylorbacteria bacterium RIFCSPLOWO2_12_FULL_43_20]